MSQFIRVLVVEDVEDEALLVIRELERGGYTVTYQRVETAKTMIGCLNQSWDVIISDYNMPSFSGLDALKLTKEMNLDIPFIVVSGVIGEEIAIETMKAGASDYVMKDNLARLASAVERELAEKTRRKNLEDQFYHAQKMEAVGRLAGGIAHDFNNLLTALMWNADSALKKLPAGQPIRKNLTQIQDVAERAAKLTSQILAFSRKQPREPRVVNLNDLLTDMKKLLGRLIGEDIELVTRSEVNLESVRVDPSQMEQVILNLAVNSRDAMPKGGKLIIESSNILCGAEKPEVPDYVAPGGYVMVQVTDTGCGMSEELKSHIFEPFFTSKEPGTGTGLGLSTCYGIIKQNGGYIWTESELGRGSAFRVCLPCVEKVAEPFSTVKQVHSLPRGSETILLVEDEAQLLDLIVHCLEAQGYSVIAVHNGLEALAILEDRENTKIDLLLSDMVMPRLSGTELLERFRGLRPNSRVLFMSGYPERAFDPTIPLLLKPFTPSTLMEKVRAVLDSGPSRLSREDDVITLRS